MYRDHKGSGDDLPSKLDLLFSHSSLNTENITYGPPLGEMASLALKADYIAKKKCLKTKRRHTIEESIKKIILKL